MLRFIKKEDGMMLAESRNPKLTCIPKWLTSDVQGNVYLINVILSKVKKIKTNSIEDWKSTGNQFTISISAVVVDVYYTEPEYLEQNEVKSSKLTIDAFELVLRAWKEFISAKPGEISELDLKECDDK